MGALTSMACNMLTLLLAHRMHMHAERPQLGWPQVPRFWALPQPLLEALHEPQPHSKAPEAEARWRQRSAHAGERTRLLRPGPSSMAASFGSRSLGRTGRMHAAK